LISEKLIDDPVVVVGADHGQSPYMEKISKAQAYANKERGNPYANTKRKVEINPSHPAIKELFERVKDDPDSETEELAQVLFEGALINSGYVLSDTHDFSKRFYRLFNGALGIPRNAPIEEV
jgi:heat shock protein beta